VFVLLTVLVVGGGVISRGSDDGGCGHTILGRAVVGLALVVVVGALVVVVGALVVVVVALVVVVVALVVVVVALVVVVVALVVVVGALVVVGLLVVVTGGLVVVLAVVVVCRGVTGRVANELVLSVFLEGRVVEEGVGAASVVVVRTIEFCQTGAHS